jgi:hypothetical protein
LEEGAACGVGRNAIRAEAGLQLHPVSKQFEEKVTDAVGFV